MIYGLWQSAAGVQAQQVRQDVLAHNLANAETPGFKPQRVSFRERIHASRSGGVPGGDAGFHAASAGVWDRLTGGVTLADRHTDFRTAPLVQTSNPLDLAIAGDGFLTVRAEGATRYTRDGRLTLRQDGTLITAAGGHEVLDTQGRTIRLDPRQRDAVVVDEHGNIRQGNTTVARLALVDFADRAALQADGGNTFDASTTKPIQAGGRVRQFAYESSGAEPVATLVSMIEASRAYGMNGTLITLQDQTLGRAVNDIARVA